MRYTHISTAATTVVASKPGYLKSLTVNATANGTITIYDNTAASGNIIAVLKANVAEMTYLYQADFKIGLTIVTAAASDITLATGNSEF